MRALLCEPLPEQIGNRRLIVSQEDAPFIMARGEDFIIAGPEKRAPAPLREVFRLDAWRDFTERPDCGLGNVTVEK